MDYETESRMQNEYSKLLRMREEHEDRRGKMYDRKVRPAAQTL